MCVMAEPKLEGIASLKITAYDETKKFNTSAYSWEQSTLRSICSANNIEIYTITTELFTLKVENVYLLVRLL